MKIVPKRIACACRRVVDIVLSRVGYDRRSLRDEELRMFRKQAADREIFIRKERDDAKKQLGDVIQRVAEIRFERERRGTNNVYTLYVTLATDVFASPYAMNRDMIAESIALQVQDKIATCEFAHDAIFAEKERERLAYERAGKPRYSTHVGPEGL
jgi:hypothetical protein